MFIDSVVIVYERKHETFNFDVLPSNTSHIELSFIIRKNDEGNVP